MQITYIKVKKKCNSKYQKYNFYYNSFSDSIDAELTFTRIFYYHEGAIVRAQQINKTLENRVTNWSVLLVCTASK